MNIAIREWLNQTIAELEEERDATPDAINEDAAMALAAMIRAKASLVRSLFTNGESVAKIVTFGMTAQKSSMKDSQSSLTSRHAFCIPPRQLR